VERVSFSGVTTRRRSPGSLAGFVRRHRTWAAAAVALIAVVLAAAGWLAFGSTGSSSAGPPQRASAAKACAAALLADWSDGRIDRAYPLSCYREALKTLPTDLEVYSSAPEDIASALRDRIVQGAVTRHSTR
jgi:hypothetical protein